MLIFLIYQNKLIGLFVSLSTCYSRCPSRTIISYMHDCLKIISSPYMPPLESNHVQEVNNIFDYGEFAVGFVTYDLK